MRFRGLQARADTHGILRQQSRQNTIVRERGSHRTTRRCHTLIKEATGRYASPQIHDPLCSGHFGTSFGPIHHLPSPERPLVATETNPGLTHLQSSEEDRSKLPPNAVQMARIIGVESDIEKLSSLAPAKGGGAASGLSVEELSLRQQIAEAVVATSLDVDSVVAEIDYERDQTVELRSLLRYKRDRAIGSTNLAVLAAGTRLGIVSGLLQFSKTTSSAGNAVGFAAGGISTLFSLRSFRQVHGGRRPA